MKALVIEDEKHQQELLLDALEQNFPNIKCMGVASDVDGALSMIKTIGPDLVFLDVVLGDKTCFDLLEQIDERSFDIIFTTSYQEYAIKAFRLAAIDYLLKPIDLNELKAAIEKLDTKKKGEETFDHIRVLLANNQALDHGQPKVALPTLTGFILVAVNEIIRCESDNTYTTFYLKDGRHILISKTLKACEKMLTDHAFQRVHNSSLINLRYVKEYIKGEGGIIVMEDNSEVNVSRRKKDEFLRRFSKIRI